MFDKYFNNPDEKTIIYCPIGTVTKIENIFDIVFPGDYKRIISNIKLEFKEFEKLNNEEVLPGMFVTSYNVEHGTFNPAYGYTIECENKVVGISGDSAMCQAVENIVEKSDVSILDVTHIEKKKKSHMSLEEMKELMHKYPHKKIIPTHMNDITKKEANNIITENFIVLNDADTYVF